MGEGEGEDRVEARDVHRIPGVDPAYLTGWTQGVADASARIMGVVAAELGPGDPLIERIVIAIGRLAGDDRYDEPL